MELKNLDHTGSVEDYQRQFLALLFRCDDLSIPQQINLFTAGLANRMCTYVELHAPADLHTAMSLTRAYEQRDTTDSAPKALALRAPFKGLIRAPKALPSLSAGVTVPAPATTNTGQRPCFRQLSPEDLAAKQAKGECYYCPESYTPGHRCHGKGVFLLELDDDRTVEDMADELDISLHALTGIDVADTMTLQVVIKGVTLMALVDTRSTHTFVRDNVARQLGLPIAPRSGLSVKVANGDRVPSAGVCVDTAVHITDEDFHINCYALPLASFDVVLVVHLLRTLGPILWNFEALIMFFWRHGHTVRWTSIGRTAPCCSAISTRGLLEVLLSSFTNIFEPPRGLPPQRRHDHRIHLLPNAIPVVVRSYRYPQLLKDEIEKQCDDMLAQRIICDSTSVFSSPVLLVKKVDGTWRFCVDYRELNGITVKVKYPIPLVDELLDELSGTCFFTKLDLHSGYHQVRMHPDDIDKTTFRTHRGLFEFMVMSFGLTSAPSTF